MKKVQSNLKFLFLIGILFAFVTYTGCNNDDEKGDDVAKQFIGTWTVTNIDIQTDIGGMSIKDFLMNVGGLDEITATATETFIESMIAANFTGSLTINENHTYVTTFGGGDDGTWSINSAGNQITVDAGTVDEMVIDVISISGNTLVVSVESFESYDLDNDPLTPDVDINISIQMTLTK
jgi:hypothetical protein